MDDFLKSLDWRIKAVLWIGCVAIAAMCAIASVRLAVEGPWWAVGLVAAVGAGLVSQEEKFWPKWPEKIQDKMIDKWRSVRSKSTKSAQGQLVWNLCRTAVIAFLAIELVSVFSEISGAAYWIVILSFSVSAGFFGFEAAFVGGLVAGLICHFGSGMATGIDFTNPAQREVFFTQWQAGARQLSWFWAFAIMATVPAWVGIAAGYKGAKTKIVARLVRRV